MMAILAEIQNGLGRKRRCVFIKTSMTSSLQLSTITFNDKIFIIVSDSS